MVDNLIKGVLLGIFGFIWWWAGTSVPWLHDGNMGAAMGTSYMFYTIVAAALLASGK